MHAIGLMRHGLCFIFVVDIELIDALATKKGVKL
jgi:hypothetical protein